MFWVSHSQCGSHQAAVKQRQKAVESKERDFGLQRAPGKMPSEEPDQQG